MLHLRITYNHMVSTKFSIDLYFLERLKKTFGLDWIILKIVLTFNDKTAVIININLFMEYLIEFLFDSNKTNQ